MLDSSMWFLTCGEFPTGGEWRSCQVGNDRSEKQSVYLRNKAKRIFTY